MRSHLLSRADRRRLRVGVPGYLTTLPLATGFGNMWHHVLAELSRHADVLPSPPRRALRRPDVWLADGHQAVADLPAPLVVHLHEAGWHTRDLQETLHPAFLEALEQNSAAACRRARAVITPSFSARAQVIERYEVDPARVFAIHHGVDSTVFDPSARRRIEPLLRQAGVPDIPYVLFASSLHPRKNLAALRGAVDRLIDEGLRVQLLIVAADAPDRTDSTGLRQAALEPLTSSGSEVRCVENPTDAELATLMAGAAAFCHPSLMEGFGLTALEAMACGAPTVVSDRGSLPEVVGECGIVVEPSAGAIAAGLRRVLVDRPLADRLGRQARDRAIGMTWGASAADWHDVLAAAAGRAPFPRADPHHHGHLEPR